MIDWFAGDYGGAVANAIQIIDGAATVAIWLTLHLHFRRKRAARD